MGPTIHLVVLDATTLIPKILHFDNALDIRMSFDKHEESGYGQNLEWLASSTNCMFYTLADVGIKLNHLKKQIAAFGSSQIFVKQRGVSLQIFVVRLVSTYNGQGGDGGGLFGWSTKDGHMSNFQRRKVTCQTIIPKTNMWQEEEQTNVQWWGTISASGGCGGGTSGEVLGTELRWWHSTSNMKK